MAAVLALVLLAVGGYWVISTRSGQTVAAPAGPTSAAPAPTTAPTGPATSDRTAEPTRTRTTVTTAPDPLPDGSTQPRLSAEQAKTLTRASALVGPLVLAPTTLPPMYERVSDPMCLAYDVVNQAYLREVWVGQSGSASGGDQQTVTIRVFDEHDSAMSARAAYEPCLAAAVKAGVTDTTSVDEGVVAATSWWTTRTKDTATLSCIYGNVAFTRAVSGSTPPPTSLCETFAAEVRAAAT